MRLALFEVQPSKKPTELTAVDRQIFAFIATWPLEPTALKAPIIEPESVMFPKQDFELVSASIAENKQTI